jgi:hypothetical protein
MPDLSLPPGVSSHEGEDALWLTPSAGLESAHELPRFEVFGEAARLTALATALAPALLGEEGLVAQLELSRAPVEDPSDRTPRHLLRVHARELFARDALWRRLFAEGVRAYRWLQPHWRWDRWCYGVLVGPAPLARVEAAVNALWGETCDRLVWLEPARLAPDPAVRAFLRGKAEVLRVGASAEDEDAPAARLETAVTLVDAGSSVQLAASAHRLVVAPHPIPGLVSEGQTALVRAGGTVRLEPTRRHLLSPGAVEDGHALVLEPESGTARWVRVE